MTSEGRLQLGWRLLIYTLVFVVCVVGTSLVGHAPRSLVPRWLLGILTTALATISLLWSFHFLRARMDRRPWSWFGLSASREGGVGLSSGVGVGVLMLAAPSAPNGAWAEINPVWAFQSLRVLAAVGSAATSFGIGFSEEMLNRGAYLQNLGERLPLWAATVASGLAFGIMHLANPAQHTIGNPMTDRRASSVARRTLFTPVMP